MEFIDCFNRRIELSDVRWDHIIETHPEIKELIKELEGALMEPELIQRSVYNEKVVLFYTAYITDRIKSGDVIWTKN